MNELSVYLLGDPRNQGWKWYCPSVRPIEGVQRLNGIRRICSRVFNIRRIHIRILKWDIWYANRMAINIRCIGHYFCPNSIRNKYMYSYLYISIVSHPFSSLLVVLQLIFVCVGACVMSITIPLFGECFCKFQPFFVKLNTKMQFTLANLHDILAIRSLKLKDNYTFDLLHVISLSNVIGL